MYNPEKTMQTLADFADNHPRPNHDGKSFGCLAVIALSLVALIIMGVIFFLSQNPVCVTC